MELSNYYRPVNIGTLEIPGNLFLAPLAGYTDRAFRTLAREYGADLCFSEMVSCEAIARENKKTLPLMERAEGEDLFAIQIFSGTVDSLERSLDGIARFNPSLIDLNCGCPVPKVVKTGAGSALLKEPKKIAEMIKVMKRLGIPVTIKIRSGWDYQSLNFLDVGKIAQDAGADMISLHARTRSQGYSGYAKWEHLKELKQALTIPVFGSGDLFTGQAGMEMLQQTGIDGLLFARGALGNPYIFSETKELLLGKNEIHSSWDSIKRIETAERHFKLSIKYNGVDRTCKEIRKHLCYYTKGLPGSSELRKTLIKCTTPEEYETQFHEYLKYLKE